MSGGFPVEIKWPWEIWTNYNSIISLYWAKNTYVRYNKSLCVQCNVVYYRYNAVQKISRIYFSYLTETSCPFINNFLFDHQPGPWQSSLHICILWIWLLREYICVNSFLKVLWVSCKKAMLLSREVFLDSQSGWRHSYLYSSHLISFSSWNVAFGLNSSCMKPRACT